MRRSWRAFLRAVHSWHYGRRRRAWYRRAWGAARRAAAASGRAAAELRRQLDARDAEVRGLRLEVEYERGAAANHAAHAEHLATMLLADTRVQEARQAAAAGKVARAERLTADRPAG